MNASLYIHIPFCLQKCDYCDFFSQCTSIPDTFIPDLYREIKYKKKLWNIHSWDTVYIGGGTPSLLQSNSLDILKDEITSNETTIEANPDDINEVWLTACINAGITRLSVGIQSLTDSCLQSVGRRGNRDRTLEALNTIQRTWKGDLSFDLIAGLPHQCEADLLSDIETLHLFSPDHFSLYTLSIEEGTPLAKKIKSGDVSSNFDDVDSLWLIGAHKLKTLGYNHYEVSNFAKNGKESKHNSVYWHCGNWVGVGPGASGTIYSGDTGERCTNTTDVDYWHTNPCNAYLKEKLERKDCILEYVLMGMRLREGIERKAFCSRFQKDVLFFFQKTVKKWEDQGLLTLSKTHLMFTSQGFLFLNRFLSEIIEEL